MKYASLMIMILVPNFDEYNPKAQSSDLVTCFGLPERNKRDNCDCSDQAQELIRVKSQVAALQNQFDSLSSMNVDSMNVVVESISRIVVPDEGSDLHSVIRLRTMRMEFSSILEGKNKVLDDRENMIVNLQHKLAEVSKERDELKYNYCLIDGP